MIRRISLIVFTCLCVGNTVEAHHSRANYDLQAFLDSEGTVVEFSWTNPHAFAVIEIDDRNGGSKRLLLGCPKDS